MLVIICVMITYYNVIMNLSSNTAPFSIDSETGDIIVTYTLDYETNTNYSFTVYVTDNGMDVVRMNSTEVCDEL